MIEKGLTPGVIQYGALIDAYGKSGDVESAQRTFDEMIEKGLTPGVIEYGALIDAYGKSGDPETGEEKFRNLPPEMEISDEELARFFNLMIRGYAQFDSVKDANRLKEEMVNLGLSPDQYTLGSLNNLYDRTRYMESDTYAVRPKSAEEWKELAILYDDIIHELNQPVAAIGARSRAALNHLKKKNFEKAEGALVELRASVKNLGNRLRFYKDSDKEDVVMGSDVGPKSAEERKELAILYDDIIHELNQPVGAIGNQSRAALNHVKKKNFDNAEKALVKLRASVKKLGNRLGLYKALQHSDKKDVVVVSDIIQEVLQMLETQIKKAKVTPEIRIYDKNKWNRPLYLHGDPFHYRLAIRALIHNAIQACSKKDVLPGRKKVIVRAQYSPSRSHFSTGWIDIYVRDLGNGIPEEHRESIFKRGFTTKKGRGLGLGLSLAQSVADQYQGWLRLEEDIEFGAEFWLRFPAGQPENK